MSGISSMKLFVLLSLLLACRQVQAQCPATVTTNCVSWALAGGNQQSLHATIRIRDENGNPVNGAEVMFTPDQPKGKVAGQNKYGVDDTTSTTSSSYQDEIDAQCPTDADPYSGTTSAICWQKIYSGVYSIEVTNVIVPGCSGTTFDATNNLWTYTN